MPRNSLSDCNKQYAGTEYENIRNEFCECVHLDGDILDDCLDKFADQKKRMDEK
jgi:hypothetical protein